MNTGFDAEVAETFLNGIWSVCDVYFEFEQKRAAHITKQEQ